MNEEPKTCQVESHLQNVLKMAQTLQLSAADRYSHSTTKLVSLGSLTRTGPMTIDVCMNGSGAGAVDTGVREQSTSFTYKTRQKDDDDSREDTVMNGGNEDKSKTETTDVKVTSS
jgi:hypothetical protein